MSNPRKQSHNRTDSEWYRIVMDCRKSGLSDAQYCNAHGISKSTLCSAIKWLRQKSFSISEKSADVDIHDLTLPKQDIVNDIQPPMRNDFFVVKEYINKFQEDKKVRIPIPITCLYGRDDPVIRLDQIKKWESYTCKEFNCFEYPGNHFFIFNKDNIGRIMEECKRQ